MKIYVKSSRSRSRQQYAVVESDEAQGNRRIISTFYDYSRASDMAHRYESRYGYDDMIYDAYPAYDIEDYLIVDMTSAGYGIGVFSNKTRMQLASADTDEEARRMVEFGDLY